ncbi:hypothetical protein [Gordonia sp. NPDC003422]
MAVAGTDERIHQRPIEHAGDDHDRPVARSTYTRKLREAAARYEGKPLDVSFREMVGPLPADDLTHAIYPYPARLIRHIPRFLLGAEQVIGGVDYILDPFCGSGTILLEASRCGIPSYGFDQNPVAALISSVKTTPRDPAELGDALKLFLELAKKTRRSCTHPEYLARWYTTSDLSILSRSASALSDLEGLPGHDFLKLTLALAARRFALMDPRIPVPVRDRNFVQVDRKSRWHQVEHIGATMINKISRLPPGRPTPMTLAADARSPKAWELLPKNLNGIVITSPPYGASQKYIRSTSLEAGWLGFSGERGTANLESCSIGREHIRKRDVPEESHGSTFGENLKADLNELQVRSPERYRIYAHYFHDMEKVLAGIRDSKSIEKVIMILGDNWVAGDIIQTSSHIRDMMRVMGFIDRLTLRDKIAGRSLLTARKGVARPADAEYITIFARGC